MNDIFRTEKMTVYCMIVFVFQGQSTPREDNIADGTTGSAQNYTGTVPSASGKSFTKTELFNVECCKLILYFSLNMKLIIRNRSVTKFGKETFLFTKNWIPFQNLKVKIMRLDDEYKLWFCATRPTHVFV